LLPEDAVNEEYTDLAILTIGGVGQHAQGQRRFKDFDQYFDANVSNLFVACKMSSVENPDIIRMLKESKAKILDSYTPLDILWRLRFYNTFLDTNVANDSIYHNRILTGAIPFSFNTGMPMIADEKLARIYNLHARVPTIHEVSGAQFISELRNFDFKSWNCERKMRILVEQAKLCNFITRFMPFDRVA
jgi:hypothetical protein